MFGGIALACSQLPVSLLESGSLSDRLHRRSPAAGEEAWFLQRDRHPLLPVWHEGRLQLVSWGSPGPKGNRVWQCRQEALTAGGWASLEPVEVLIPANFCLDSGVWYDVREGLRGVLVEREQNRFAYVLTQPVSHYYEVMCSRAKRMPVFEGQYI